MKRIRPSKPPEPQRSFECPQCNKRRMIRPIDHAVSNKQQEYKTFKGHTVTLFVDVCDYCVSNNNKKYFEPSKADIRTFFKAMKELKKEDNEASLEDLL
jgi:hypothetical protein